ncbi:Hpt domain-containing protein [Ferrimonas senticii]|uniref:Hpt domain-containing protein n=1 Tax=Ferrimonas senticii TaxID=394566 RepID=UPI0004123769|nr:Hpt domain-containing protein [Ferrimonas senticii]
MTLLMDQHKLQQMAEDAGEEMLPMLVAIFVEELAQSESELRQCHDGQVAAIAHKVKGSASTFGAESLRLVCKELEYVAKGDLSGDVSQLKSRCLTTMAATLAEYQQFTAEQMH